MPTAELPRRWAWPALAIVLTGGLGLRLWGVAQGLPYAYNADEADHFVRCEAFFHNSGSSRRKQFWIEMFQTF